MIKGYHEIYVVCTRLKNVSLRVRLKEEGDFLFLGPPVDSLRQLCAGFDFLSNSTSGIGYHSICKLRDI